ncbi:MAG TPA: twin-arginine translocase subunit TatC [Candidatus Binatia bacterium]|nr:twin-arginine translocase subunit TatC [Candidatus Binatia bacterium]
MSAPPGPGSTEQPLVAHLLELRSRLLKGLCGFVVAVVPALVYSQELYSWLAAPLLQFLPAGGSMIATEVASPFFAPVKLASVTALAAAMPWILYQVWAFVAPGLYQSERRLVVPLLFSSTLLFYLGVAFAYFLVLPAVFHFVVGVAPPGVAVMTDITKYLDFALTIFIVFGVAFETPVAIVLLVWSGFVTPARLADSRAYVLVGAFVLGAILTPPDVLSQTLLAGCIYLLFELGIVAARVLVPGAREVERQQQH